MRLAELQIPARAEFVSLARLVVSSIADDRYELTDDQLDNLKLAVSEACVIAIDAQPSVENREIAIECIGQLDLVEVVVSSSPGDGASSGGSVVAAPVDVDAGALDQHLGIPLIGSLVDEVTIEQDEHTYAAQIRLRVRCDRLDID